MKRSKKNDLPESLEELEWDLLQGSDLQIRNFRLEKESSEYGASNFEIENLKILFRISKITPTKIGHFVTLWKRNSNGFIEPYHFRDTIDYAIIIAKNKNHSGQFVFPKRVLRDQAILSDKKEGKRGFRLYPPWDTPSSRQARKTQEWQTKFFLENSKDLESDRIRLKKLLKL